MDRTTFLTLWACAGPFLATSHAYDGNGNTLSDLWELRWNAVGLTAAGDADGDGFSNAAEALAGTDPLSGWSIPDFSGSSLSQGAVRLEWSAPAGKRVELFSSPSLATPFTSTGITALSTGSPDSASVPGTGPRAFYQIAFSDVDTDADGLTDYEEGLLGFDRTNPRTGFTSQTDLQRVTAGLSGSNAITVSVYDDTADERWPDPILFAVRRTGTGLQPLTVNVTLTGSATRGADYSTSLPGTEVTFALGQREAFVTAVPVTDSEDSEPDESVTLTAIPGSGYTLGTTTAATGTIRNQTAASGPGAKEAARFLIQAAWGPDQDSAADPDQIPENVETVMQTGIAAWIEDQFTRPPGLLQPMVQWQIDQPASAEIYNDKKQNAWWGRVMGLPGLTPDAPAQLPDPLRQRIGYSLSQIFVISDRMEDLAVDPLGMANFYDTLLTHSFGNFRDLLQAVALHPCMGMYLSHLGNRKPDPVAHTFPDENFAREIMQLFSIGLWELHPDGSRVLDGAGNPVPTYDNTTITEFARVFTGLAFGGTNSNFGLYPRDFTTPMKGWDAEHDLAPKTLLRGFSTPARTASPGNTGTATMADVSAAVDNLFQHPNVGPFLGRQLIQRLVTSNPSPAYIDRVSAAFADNGSGIRGDMKAVVRAILLDPEARDPARMDDPASGKLREPLVRCVNLATAFHATADEGWYYLDAFILDHSQEPLKSPSVFNFYLPSYAPPGVLAQSGLVAPEFQIINATSGTMAPNYFWNAITGGLHRWGTGRASRETRLDLTQEMLLNVPAAAVNDPYPNLQPLDPDPLLRRLDLVLTGGTLSPEQFQIIREALLRIGPGTVWEWPRNRLKLAIYLILTSPDFCVQR